MSGSPVPTARCSLKEQRNIGRGPLGALRSSERPFYPSPDTATSLIRAPVPSPPSHTFASPPLEPSACRRDHSTLLVSTSGLQRRHFMILPFRC